jgi:hypothetical protein
MQRTNLRSMLILLVSTQQGNQGLQPETGPAPLRTESVTGYFLRVAPDLDFKFQETSCLEFAESTAPPAKRLECGLER